MEPFIKSDDLQWRRHRKGRTYQLVEVRKMLDLFYPVWGEVNLDRYDSEEIQDILDMYGYKSMDALKAEYGDIGADEILSECLFESLNPYGMYNSGLGPKFDSEDNAAAYAEGLVKGLSLTERGTR
jgi:hypothetical protein